MWTAREIEIARLQEIVAILRLTAAHRTPINSPSEWTGWQVVNPESDRRTYAERSAAGLCTRCGKHPPRAGRRTCQRCADDQAARSAALRARRKAAGICVDCGAAAPGSARCVECLKAYRGPGRWGRKRRRSARHTDYAGPADWPEL